MGKINVSRLILGGIVAGIVFDVLSFLVQGVMLGPQWDEGIKALSHTGGPTYPWIWLNVDGLIGGIVALWFYAGIRPRFGAGPKTAIYVGLALWVSGLLLPNLTFMWILGLFPNHLTLMTTLFGLVPFVLATVAGAAVYKEA